MEATGSSEKNTGNIDLGKAAPFGPSKRSKFTAYHAPISRLQQAIETYNHARLKQAKATSSICSSKLLCPAKNGPLHARISYFLVGAVTTEKDRLSQTTTSEGCPPNGKKEQYVKTD